jgi:ribosomal protein S18 acetylase RimI-like enzyme
MVDSGRSVRIVRDEWLSDKLGRPAVRFKITDGPLPVAELQSALAGLEPGLFAFVKLPAAGVENIKVFEEVGFRMIDVAVTFSRPVEFAKDDISVQVGFAVSGDEESVSRVARAAFSYSRFHLDPYIPRHVADEIKAQWASNYFRGRRGDAIVVARSAGEVVGFLQLLLTEDALVIDLIGVAEKGRRQGLAKAMIRFAEQNMEPRPIIRVGTQAANVPSIHLYESMGFRFQSSQVVMHFHGVP